LITIKKKFEDRKEEINYLRHIFSVCQKLLFAMVIVIVIEMFYNILDFYQYTAIGVEEVIRSRTIGFIGASGEQSDLYYVFVKLSNYFIIVWEFFFIIMFIRYFKYYQNQIKTIPLIYRKFLPTNKSLLRDLIIPFGLFNGCILALSFIIIFNTISIDEPLIFMGLGVVPLIIIILASIRVLIEKNNKFRIQYFLSMAIFILFQF
jgi:hypothetical protein